ncbi:MAG: Aminopeptidase 2 [Chlamydiae bacterium]|nr:Aminopeptidase 2 [Chlamydiota bacterium]
MKNPRLEKLASILVEYSCTIQPKQLVMIKSDPVAMPLIDAIYVELIKKGAYVDLKLSPDHLKPLFFKYANEDQLKYCSKLDLHTTKTIDAYIGIWSEVNTKALSHTSIAKQALNSASKKELSSIFMERAGKEELNWCGTLFPTQASAQDAEMSLDEYEEFVFNAGYLNHKDPVKIWKEIDVKQQKVANFLNTKKMLRFKAYNGTDLEVNVEDMKWISCCGKNNFPDGEVFTGPNLTAKDGGVNGYVHYSFPAIYRGHEVHDIELTFEKGVVVDYKASKGLDFLKAMIHQDEGSKRLGEIAIGTNFQIKEHTKNILFDEKIGGTFHAALGSGYPETGNKNMSGLHWDMICDLRKGGTVEADGEVILKDGKFVFDDWPSA